MAGINVNQITSMLAKLQPDLALQQYAQMHKNDPYIVSLAAHESNRRKEARLADQAAQGAQPQPKVVDATIAQMAPQPMPEDVGIGQLRAPNMQFGAEGGIMGYDEGYDEGGMTYGQDPVMMMADGGVARFNGSQSQFVQDLASIPAAYKKWWQQNREEDAEKAAKEQAMAQRRQEMMDARQKTSFANYLFGSPEREAEGQAALAELTKPTGSMPGPGYTRAGMKGDPRLNVPLTQPLQTEQLPPVANKKPSAAPRPGAGAGPAAAVPEQSEIERFLAMQKAMGMGPEANADLAWQRSQLADRMRAQSKGELEDFEKDVAARGKYGEAKEERLAKREADLGKRKDENTGLALLEAGLAIMSTPGKLAEAVGKGAQVGLKTYGAGLEKLRAAQEKMDDARDQIEEFRRNEANMTAKERRQFKSQINRTETDIEKMAVDAAKDMYGFKREDTKAVFSAAEQTRNLDKEIKGRKEAAQIAAGPGYQRNELLKASQGQEAKVRAEYGKMQAKVMDLLSKDQDYMMAEPAKKQLMQTTALRQALMNNPFLASYASGIGFSSTPTGGKVYDLTED